MTMLPCVLCGQPAPTAVLCRACLALRCACGHYVGDHDPGGSWCMALPCCWCERLEVEHK